MQGSCGSKDKPLGGSLGDGLGNDICTPYRLYGRLQNQHGLYEPFAWGGRGVRRTHMVRGRWGESFTDKAVLVSGLISRASGRRRRKGPYQRSHFHKSLRQTEATAVSFASKATPTGTKWSVPIFLLSLCGKASRCCPVTFGILQTVPLARVQVYSQRAA